MHPLQFFRYLASSKVTAHFSEISTALKPCITRKVKHLDNTYGTCYYVCAKRKFVPEVPPDPYEIQALEEDQRDRLENGTTPHEAINWD